MKNSFFKLIGLGALLVGFASCEKDEVRATAEVATTPTFTATSSLPASGVLTSSDAARIGVIYTWTPLTFTTSAPAVIPVTYSLEVAKRGTNFANSTTITLPNKVNANRDTIKIGDLNAALIRAGLTPEVVGSVDIRLRAAYANNMPVVTSTNSQTITATPYSRELYAFGGIGTLSATSPFVRETAPRKYDGYIYVPVVGTSTTNTFRFSNTSSSSGTVTGISTQNAATTSTTGVITVTGTMAAAGAGTDITLTSGKMYRIELDLTTNSFKATSVTWGIVGSATTNDGTGWNASKPLTYNTTTKKWEGTVSLPGTGSNNEYKFRANDDWPINFGDDGANGTLEYNGANIKLASPGNAYKVSLDLNDAGNYTYSVTQ